MDNLMIIFKEREIAEKIYIYSLPSLHDDLKRDISTFYFTWNAIMKDYILHMVTKYESMTLSSIYMHIIYVILHQIQKKEIPTSSSVYLLNNESWLLNKMKIMILKMNRESRLVLMKNLYLLTQAEVFCVRWDDL